MSEAPHSPQNLARGRFSCSQCGQRFVRFVRGEPQSMQNLVPSGLANPQLVQRMCSFYSSGFLRARKRIWLMSRICAPTIWSAGAALPLSAGEAKLRPLVTRSAASGFKAQAWLAHSKQGYVVPSVYSFISSTRSISCCASAAPGRESPTSWPSSRARRKSLWMSCMSP